MTRLGPYPLPSALARGDGVDAGTIAGRSGLPLLGNAQQLLRSTRIHLAAEEWARRYGPIVVIDGCHQAVQPLDPSAQTRTSRSIGSSRLGVHASALPLEEARVSATQPSTTYSMDSRGLSHHSGSRWRFAAQTRACGRAFANG
jgi:hypothetical protein